VVGCDARYNLEGYRKKYVQGMKEMKSSIDIKYFKWKRLDDHSNMNL
jgi:hypothetical protein